MMKLSTIIFSTFLLAIAIVPGSVRAACSNPEGVEGEQIYNSDYNVMQVCDGDNWIGWYPDMRYGVWDGEYAEPEIISCTLGEGWTLESITASYALSAVVYGEDKFVAVGSGYAASSSDGITWTGGTMGAVSPTALTYGNGVYAGIRQAGSTRNFYSADGVIWNPGDAGMSGWSGITFGNGLFVAVGSTIITSINGANWTVRTNPTGSTWQSVTYGDGLFVGVTSSGTNRVMTSPDGITWTARTAAEANPWVSVTYGNDLFVAVAGSGTNRVMTSPDGITWTARTAAEANNWKRVTFGNGIFVAVADSGTNRIMTSNDGITWEAQASPQQNTWSDIAYGDGRFVAVSADGTNRAIVNTGFDCESTGDNLGNHIATQDLDMAGNSIINASEVNLSGLPGNPPIDPNAPPVSCDPLTNGGEMIGGILCTGATLASAPVAGDKAACLTLCETTEGTTCCQLENSLTCTAKNGTITTTMDQYEAGLCTEN